MARGQAAMEFLATYGWAILVVLIAIAALAYFGIFNPRMFVSEQVIFGPEFSYAGHSFKMTNNKEEFAVALRYTLPEMVTLVANSREVMCHDCPVDAEVWKACGHVNFDDPSTYAEPGEDFTARADESFIISCKPGNDEYIVFSGLGERHTVSFRFDYLGEDDMYTRTFEGTIKGIVD